VSPPSKHNPGTTRESAWGPSRTWQAATGLGALVVLTWQLARVVGPFFERTDTYGFHDWDVQTSHRYLTLLGLSRGELAQWNPYACGGFPAWGYVEGGTLAVSPWLPLYLVFPMPLALRLEVAGMAALGALGAVYFARRFTKSWALSAMVAALWAVNGRWALQAAVGHTWHLAYAYLPMCLGALEAARAGERGPRLGLVRLPPLVMGSVAFAMLVYAGGIYPLPHAALSAGMYALVTAGASRSLRPVAALAGMGALGALLSAPKLLPVLAGFARAPRHIDSTEALDLGGLVTLLTAPEQGYRARPFRVPAYGWHEWGMYVGWAGVGIAVFALLAHARSPAPRDPRAAGLRVTGAALVVLGMGAFHPAAPWSLLHTAPVFRSQHVPSRFLYPAVLVLAALAAHTLSRWLERPLRQRPFLDAALLVPVAWLAADVARVARQPMGEAMWMVAPARIEAGPFRTVEEAPVHYVRRDWAGPMYLAMKANLGVRNCYGAPPFEPKGARASDRPGYRGEAWLALPNGEHVPHAGRVVDLTPNRIDVELDPTPEGALVVLNQNHDPGFSASHGTRAEPAEVSELEGAVAVRVPAGTTSLRLRYRARGLPLGLALAALAAAACAWLVRRASRSEPAERYDGA
jgi:hypothetical protein